MRLYDLPQVYREWLRKVDAQDGELTEDLWAELEEIEASVANKMDAYAALVRQFEYEEKAFRDEAKAMEIKAQVAAHRHEKLREMMRDVLERMDLDSVRGQRFCVRRLISTKPKITWESSDPIPEPFRKITVGLDFFAAQTAYDEVGSLPEGFKVVHKQFVTIR
jgi:hypothetical protein